MAAPRVQDGATVAQSVSHSVWYFAPSNRYHPPPREWSPLLKHYRDVIESLLYTTPPALLLLLNPLLHYPLLLNPLLFYLLRLNDHLHNPFSTILSCSIPPALPLLLYSLLHYPLLLHFPLALFPPALPLSCSTHQHAGGVNSPAAAYRLCRCARSHSEPSRPSVQPRDRKPGAKYRKLNLSRTGRSAPWERSRTRAINLPDISYGCGESGRGTWPDARPVAQDE